MDWTWIKSFSNYLNMNLNRSVHMDHGPNHIEPDRLTGLVQILESRNRFGTNLLWVRRFWSNIKWDMVLLFFLLVTSLYNPSSWAFTSKPFVLSFHFQTFSMLTANHKVSEPIFDEAHNYKWSWDFASYPS